MQFKLMINTDDNILPIQDQIQMVHERWHMTTDLQQRIKQQWT